MASEMPVLSSKRTPPLPSPEEQLATDGTSGVTTLSSASFLAELRRFLRYLVTGSFGDSAKPPLPLS